MSVVALPNTVNSKWNVVWNMNNNNWVSNEEGIHVTYPKGGYASNAGVNFRAAPTDMFPATTTTIRYRVYIPDTFEWVHGGKFGPGIWIGKPGSGGGNWNKAGASVRLMWREDGQIVSYVYCCTDLGKYNGTSDCPLVKHQGHGFSDIAHHTKGAGIDLWRDAPPALKLRKGQWNDITMSVKLNSKNAKADGVISVTVNNVSKSFSGMAWTKYPKKKKISGVLFASWFGGGSRKYAPTKDHVVTFKDVVITTDGEKKKVTLLHRVKNMLTKRKK